MKLIYSLRGMTAVKSVLPFARDNAQITHVTVEGGEHDGDEAGRGGDEGQGSAAVGQNGTITLEASAEEVGGNRCTVPARVEGPRQQIIFNARYLADALGVIGTPEVAVELISPTRPGTLTPVGSNGEYLYIVMPMQGKGG